MELFEHNLGEPIVKFPLIRLVSYPQDDQLQST